MSLEHNGKTIVSMADYKLFWNNIRVQTGYSPQYVEKHGAESFLYPDAAQSVKYSATAASTRDGYSNNTTISASFTAGTVSATASVANDGFAKRLLSNPPNAGADSSTTWPFTGAVSAATTIANQLGRGAFVAGAGTAGSIMGTWNYMLKIKHTDLHPIFKELDLLANPQIRLRFRVNQGTSAIDIDSSSRMTLTSTTLSSGNVCPVMVASAASPNPMHSVISGVGSLAVSWGAVVNALEPTIDGTYMPFTTSRLYVPFVHLENPQAIISKPVRRFVSMTATPNGSTSAQIASIHGDLTPELVNGLLDYCMWSLTNRVLIADVSRLTERDVPQAIQIQGVNAGCQRTNMLVLVVSEQELTLDCLTGEILAFLPGLVLD
ncbi:unnamed protein product [Phytophthora lilii]|uniref:Unnamed protein product n=1 Tax=Phytophthora lilii TaxID=2077276 RepID=A0A9W6WW89_9STRA|nr:unnamed protein product [Phytophthora lilii]